MVEALIAIAFIAVASYIGWISTPSDREILARTAATAFVAQFDQLNAGMLELSATLERAGAAANVMNATWRRWLAVKLRSLPREKRQMYRQRRRHGAYILEALEEIGE
jgi:hypothetical protein